MGRAGSLQKSFWQGYGYEYRSSTAARGIHRPSPRGSCEVKYKCLRLCLFRPACPRPPQKEPKRQLTEFIHRAHEVRAVVEGAHEVREPEGTCVLLSADSYDHYFHYLCCWYYLESLREDTGRISKEASVCVLRKCVCGYSFKLFNGHSLELYDGVSPLRIPLCNIMPRLSGRASVLQTPAVCLFKKEKNNSCFNMASNYVYILCGARKAPRIKNKQHSFMQNGGLFGECHVFVMHYILQTPAVRLRRRLALRVSQPFGPTLWSMSCVWLPNPISNSQHRASFLICCRMKALWQRRPPFDTLTAALIGLVNTYMWFYNEKTIPRFWSIPNLPYTLIIII